MKQILILVFVLCAASVRAESDVPAVVADGLKAFKSPGRKLAVSIWLEGSPLKNDARLERKVTDDLNQFENTLGGVTGYEEIRVVPIADSLRRVYVLLKFEKGPAYGVFDCYKAGHEWIVSALEFNGKSDAILPQSILIGDKR